MLKRVTTMAMVMALTSLAFAQTQSPAAKALASFQGSWVFTSADGQDLAGSGTEIIVTVTAEKYTQLMNGVVVESGSFKIDATKAPMHIDLLIAEGDDAGKVQLGLVEITGETMRGKLSTAGEMTRPTTLDAGDGGFAFTAKKAK